MGKEKFKTYQNVFDEFTNRNLFKLISQGHFEGMESPIAIGKEANVNVPLPIVNMHNITVMQMIGNNGPAPKLKDRIPEQPEEFLKSIINNMKKLHKGGLVHGDLSEFNILNNNEKPYFIDFSQSTTIKSNNADDLLERDCKNIARFFKKLKIEADYEK